jgi:hypothetical protein
MTSRLFVPAIVSGPGVPTRRQIDVSLRTPLPSGRIVKMPSSLHSPRSANAITSPRGDHAGARPVVRIA